MENLKEIFVGSLDFSVNLFSSNSNSHQQKTDQDRAVILDNGDF